MEGIIYDELKVYRGEDYAVNDKITVRQPTLGEICDYGEREYYAMISTLTSSPADMKWQLWQVGCDYTTLSGDFELFYKYLIFGCSKERTSIVLGDLDFFKFVPIEDKDGNFFLYDPKDDIKIDEYTHFVIVEQLRKMHGLKRNGQIPANEITKQILIEDARDEYLLNKDKEYHSQLKNLISALVNSEGFKYGHSEVWNMKIGAFMDAVGRISRIKNANLLLQSGYSAFGIDLKKVDNKQLDWLGGLA